MSINLEENIKVSDEDELEIPLDTPLDSQEILNIQGQESDENFNRGMLY